MIDSIQIRCLVFPEFDVPIYLTSKFEKKKQSPSIMRFHFDKRLPEKKASTTKRILVLAPVPRRVHPLPQPNSFGNKLKHTIHCFCLCHIAKRKQTATRICEQINFLEHFRNNRKCIRKEINFNRACSVRPVFFGELEKRPKLVV